MYCSTEADGSLAASILKVGFDARRYIEERGVKVHIANGPGSTGGSEPWKQTRRHTIRSRRPHGTIALIGVIAVIAVFLAGSPASASVGPVGALSGAAESAANTLPAPTQCQGLAKNMNDAKGCIDSNSLLGPKQLPTSGPAGSVDAYIAKMTRGYDPFGATTEPAFLDLYFNKDTWKYPPDGGFAINPKTMQPKHHTITLEPVENGRPVFVDRFGLDTGSFLAPARTSYAKRALPPQSLDTFGDSPPYNYHLYEIVKAFHVDAGRIAPWFGQKGGGLQYITCVKDDFQCPKALDPKLPNVAELVHEDMLKVVPLQ